ncbi:MAG: hypothetical protein L6R45_14205 [Anaerolineae bacterium]|nr:hypothetical protein [Anaerolineae bacterium]
MDSPKVILIAGSSSFGRLTRETPVRRGHRVFALMRDIAGRKGGTRTELISLAEKEGLPLGMIELDVTNETSIGQCEVMEQFSLVESAS